MKVGIVVPFSWSFPGGVVDHAESQAQALRRQGVDVRLVMGNDPPGAFTRFLHPRLGRHGDPPPEVIPIGRSVIVPANGSLPNIVLTPAMPARLRRVLERERFDLLHLHEPMTPAVCVTALILAECPIVATWHAAGALNWYRLGLPSWGFLIERIDYRIAVSEQARESARRWLPGEYEVIPNGVDIPPEADPGEREDRVVFIGRHEPRKGLPVLLQAWPTVHRRTGARLRVIGADPLAVRLLMTRLRVPEDGIDLLGWVPNGQLAVELRRAKALVAPSVGMESFGMVLTRAFASATPVVASDIPGYRAVVAEDTGILVPPGDPVALAEGVASLLADEGRRRAMGRAAWELACARYSWDDVGRRLLEVYELVLRRASRTGQGR
ncbi:MAG: hypothetical protein C4305_07025 [Thermoleophilia bacterium]